MKLGTIISNLINGKYNTDMLEIFDTEYGERDFTYVATKMTKEGKKYFEDIFKLPVIELKIKDEVFITINAGRLIEKVNYFLAASAGYVDSKIFDKYFILD